MEKFSTSKKLAFFGNSVDSYFSNLSNKALEEKKSTAEKNAKRQIDSFGQWREADFGS